MYKVYLANNKVFLGGSPNDSRWVQIPDIPIVKLEYTLAQKTMVMEGFEAYNHVIEIPTFLFHKGGFISKVAVMAKMKNKVYVITYNFMKRIVTNETKEFGTEWNGGASKGWKAGVPKTSPIFKII